MRLARKRLALQIVGATLGALAAINAAAGQEPSDPGPSIYASEAPGVIRIRAVGVKSDGTMDGEDGTGFVVSQSGYVLTASHVIPDDGTYKTLLLGGSFGPATAGAKTYGLQLVKRSGSYDVALLRIVSPPAVLTVLPLRKSTISVGESLFVLGYPLGLPDTHFLDGRVGALSADAITTNALVDRGNSGGPVLDVHGCVIGVVYGAITSTAGAPVYGIKFAVPTQFIADILPSDVSAPLNNQQAEGDTSVIHVSDSLSRTQTIHALDSTVRRYHDVIAAHPGYYIEAIESVGHNSLNPPDLQFPIPVIANDKTSMSFDYSLVSGPVFDQKRGWIDMTVHTLQRRIGNAVPSISSSCS